MLIVLTLAVLVLSAHSAHAQAPLVFEGYEADTPRVQVHGSNQPYEVHTLAPSADRAHSGNHSLKVDVTFMHGFEVMLSPRTDETPGVEWGGLGGPGTFTFRGLGIPLQPDKRYLLSLWVWVEQASPQNPVRFAVQTATDSPYGVARTTTTLPREFPGPTDGWVNVEAELTGLLVERLEASGAKVEGLRLSSIDLSCFANTRMRMTAYVDDVEVRELPPDAPAPAGVERVPAPSFRHMPAAEDRFVWGVYGSLFDPGPEWLKPYDRSGGQDSVRRQQAQRLADASDWILLDLRRHYCDTLVQGGGMLFAPEGQAARDYVQASLDQCQQYGIMFSPSTYLTQHYIPDATREQCLEAMKQAVAQFGKHPALLAYWLVDEPGSATAPDYYRGKAAMEELDPAHPALCTCNSIPSVWEFAPTLPLLCIDYYPLGPVPKDDLGAWAVGDSARYARRLGARRIWMLPQVFGQSSWRSPTVPEFRIQVFGALAEGATGFLPYTYAGGPTWYNPANEYGHLVDTYGNPSPCWDEMKRLGLYLRAAGPLLVGAERLPDEAAGARLNATIVSNVGRVRPAAVARAFANKAFGVKLLVVYNNTPTYRYGFQVGVAGVQPTDCVLDLFSLRDFPLQGDAFTAQTAPGDGRLYAVGSAEALAKVKAEVARRQVAIQTDLVALEVKVAKRMGTDTAPVEKAMADGQAAAGKGDWTGALEAVQTAFAALDRQERTNAAYWSVNEAVEQTREALGRIDGALSAHVGTPAFPRDAADVKALTDRVVTQSERFYALQAKLLREGPKGLESEAAALQRGIGDLSGTVQTFFGG